MRSSRSSAQRRFWLSFAGLGRRFKKEFQAVASALSISATLLAVTLSATASVEAGDWETAGQLLRRREQLLTQLENCPDLREAVSVLQAVQSAEAELSVAMELA